MPKYCHLDLHYHHFKWSMEWEVLLNYMPEQLLFQLFLSLLSQQLLRGGDEVVHLSLILLYL
jgi:hypothetical protein